MIYDSPPAEPPAQALVSMIDSPYGFSIIDLNLSSEELAVFHLFSIHTAKSFHHFGNLATLEEELVAFFNQVCDGDAETFAQAAACIHNIAKQIVPLSGKSLAWVGLRAFTPTQAFDIPRWHMDGYYYSPSKTPSFQYKFVTTLIGPSTLFYPLPRSSEHLRRVVWKNIPDRQFTAEFCQALVPISLKEGEGAFFIAAQFRHAALHSEPPIHRDRLFLSIISCNEQELAELKVKVAQVYSDH